MTDTDRRDVLARALREIRELKARQTAADARRRAPIAVVGLGCRLPGAGDPRALWRLLCDGADATSEVPPGRWTDPEAPGLYTRRGGWLPEVDGFDARFFGVSPREAQSLDPQQRLFLEVVWEALEDAAIAPDRLRDSRTGVYCGITQVDYAQVLATHAGPEQLDLHAGSGTAPSFAAGRVARTLDLRGPAMAVDTACSSSLVAVHLAAEALRLGTIDLALAGGVNLILHPAGHVVLCRGRALSPGGRCQTFDAAADGYARGEGCGVVALARLDDARTAGHRILAVIRGSAVGHDGASAGLTVPSGKAQAEVIAAACADAGVAPREVAYVEAHGTGTALGDPIELRALADALGRDRPAPLLVGALKTNIGHLESAAGVAGLIKTVLALHHGELPPHVGLVRPNPAVDWARLPVEVVRTRRPWPAGPRVAGVSAFGASGTNAHVIVSAADPVDATTAGPEPASVATGSRVATGAEPSRLASGAEPSRLTGAEPSRLASGAEPSRLTGAEPSRLTGAEPSRLASGAEPSRLTGAEPPRLATGGAADAPDGDEAELLVLSAATPTALAALAARHAAHLPAAGALADVCHTAAVGRAALPHALAVVARTSAEMAGRLAAFAAGRVEGNAGRRPDTPVPVAFVFAGQGGRRPELVRDLFERPGAFRQALERADALLRAHRPGSLIDVLTPREGPSPTDETEWAQPALFALEWALVEQWRAWGVEPRWVLGHSLGAFVAACVAGVMDLDAALGLVARRAELMQRTPPGAMAAVFAAEHPVRGTLAAGSGVAIAAVNGPAETVIAGPPAAVEAALQLLAERGLHARRLAATRAFHSPLMDGILGDFEAAVARVALRAPDRTFISDATGRPATLEWTEPAVWRRHLRETVRFADALDTLRDAGCSLCVEIGPGGALSASGRRQGDATRWITSLRRDTPGRSSLLEALGTLAVRGARVDLAAASRGRRRVSLPTYPFERQRAWIGPGGRSGAALRGSEGPLLGRRLDAPPGEALFEALWRADGPAVLRDHRVFGRCVVSGAVAGAVALAAARQIEGDQRHTMEEIDFRAPIVLPECGGLTMRIRLTRGEDRLGFEVLSLESGRSRVHVAGRIRRTEEAPPPPRDLAAIRDRCTATLAGGAFYDHFWRPERHDLGPCYRTLDRIWRRDGEALARLRPPPDMPGGEDGELVAAICFTEATGQLLMPAVPEFEAVFGDRDDTFLGSGMTRSVQHGALPSAARWIHARLAEIRADGFVGEVSLLDDEGRVLLAMEGLGVRRIDPTQLRRAATRAGEVADGRAALAGPPGDRRRRLRAWLTETVAGLVGGEGFDWEDPLSRLGFDSLMTIDLLERLEVGLGIRLDPGDALRDATLSTLAERVLLALGRDAPADAPADERTGPVLLAPGRDAPADAPADERTGPVLLAPGRDAPADAPAEAPTYAPELRPGPLDAEAVARRQADAAAMPAVVAGHEGCWRVIGQPWPAAPRRLFCLPHAGASAMAFQPWRNHAPPGLEVRAAQLPGRWTEPGAPIADLDALVAALVAALRPLLDRPWALFGASMGALLAFELVRALRREGGSQPTHLIVAGAAAPDRVHPLVAQATELRAAMTGDGDLGALVRLGLVPEVPADLLPLIVPGLRADLELVLRHQHRPEPALACPIVALSGAGDSLVGRHLLAGWVAHTAADFTLRQVPGGHLFYQESPAETWRALGPLMADA